MISKTVKEDILKLKKKFPQKRSAIMQALHLVLRERNYVEKENLSEIAKLLELPQVEVFETASFYTMFPQKKVGKYHIQVCTNLSCSLLGAEELVKYLKDKLRIKVGETTPDDMFTLTTVECLGSCGTAPMMQINEDYHENLTKEKVDKIVDDLSKK